MQKASTASKKTAFALHRGDRRSSRPSPQRFPKGSDRFVVLGHRHRQATRFCCLDSALLITSEVVTANQNRFRVRGETVAAIALIPTSRAGVGVTLPKQRRFMRRQSYKEDLRRAEIEPFAWVITPESLFRFEVNRPNAPTSATNTNCHSSAKCENRNSRVALQLRPVASRSARRAFEALRKDYAARQHRPPSVRKPLAELGCSDKLPVPWQAFVAFHCVYVGPCRWLAWLSSRRWLLIASKGEEWFRQEIPSIF